MYLYTQPYDHVFQQQYDKNSRKGKKINDKNERDLQIKKEASICEFPFSTKPKNRDELKEPIPVMFLAKRIRT